MSGSAPLLATTARSNDLRCAVWFADARWAAGASRPESLLLLLPPRRLAPAEPLPAPEARAMPTPNSVDGPSVAALLVPLAGGPLLLTLPVPVPLPWRSRSRGPTPTGAGTPCPQDCSGHRSHPRLAHKQRWDARQRESEDARKEASWLAQRSRIVRLPFRRVARARRLTISARAAVAACRRDIRSA